MMILKIIACFFLIIANEFSVFGIGVELQGLANSKQGWAYQGHLYSEQRTVTINPELRALPTEKISSSMEICGFFIHQDPGATFPFLVSLKSKRFGNAEISMKPEIKFEHLKDRYTFQIEAFDCDQPPHFSERRFVLIEIGIVNIPRFLKPAYEFVILSSLTGDSEIGEVVAFERPIGELKRQDYQGICRYDIISSNPVPFSIDNFGRLYTKKLNTMGVTVNKYRFFVRATDCNVEQPRKSSVPVIVDVRDSCQPHWTGFPSSVKYIHGSGILPLIATGIQHINLHVCSRSCTNFNMILTARLHGKGLKLATHILCKQDSQSIMKQETMCEGNIGAVDLLKHSPTTMIDQTNGAYFFDTSHVPAQLSFDNTNHVLGRSFTIMFWMKHGQMKTNDPKEQIICNSDSQVKNRHHYSLFLHNCKLILLLRKEHWQASVEMYQPSEWRFGPLNEVCDNSWHHYALLFDDGNLAVQIDGEISQKVPELLVEKPLHKLPDNIQGTRFTVGSCFHSKNQSYVQHFKGHLAGMKLLNDNVEAVNTVRCMATCGEAVLVPHIVETIETDSSVTLFSQDVVIRSQNIEKFLSMISKISYVNINPLSDMSGTEERRRTLTVDTEIRCTSGTVMKVPQNTISIEIVDSPVLAQSRNEPKLYFSIVSESEVKGYLKKPIYLFPNLQFIKANKESIYLLSCIVRPEGLPIQSWEYINWPANLAINARLTSLNNTHGLLLDGRQLSTVYEDILRSVTYVAQRSDERTNNRKFGLICAISRSLSTKKKIITVVVKQDDFSTYYVVEDQDTNKIDPFLHPSGNNKQGFEDRLSVNKKTKKHSSSTFPLVGVITAVLVVIAAFIIGFVVYMKRRNLTKHSAPNQTISLNAYPSMMKDKTCLYNETVPTFDNDAGSITSDCPACDEDDKHNDSSDDDNTNSTVSTTMRLPNHISISPKMWSRLPNKPVDV